MVIVIGMILMALAIILMTTSGGTKENIFELKEKYQARFLALGGQQHALLKFRLLPTQFYDAAAYAIGKNPYYDFTRPMDRYNNPGPMFFTGTVPVPTYVEDASGRQVPLLSRDDNWAFTPADREFKGAMATHLNRFLKDIRSGYPEGNGVIVLNSDSHEDKAMGNNWRDPYNGSYFVDRVFIFGSQGSLSYSTDSVLVSCRGIAQRAGQVSIIPQPDGAVRDLTRQYLRFSTTQAGSGFEGQTDVAFSNQEKFEFLEKYEADLANPDPMSSARGEAVTATYEVQREK
ncbi:hypothetical protein HOF92_15060 [bacterium]|jgi:hypothetical protein|nr:hypothetical protein [bacterium]